MSDRVVAARAASLLLRYPDEEVLAALPAVMAALDELPGRLATPLAAVAAHRAGADPIGIAAEYVETFDFRRRCALHLTYYTHGDTRARGQALAGFVAAYRAAGLAVTGGELPDYLPAVLDLATAADSGWALLGTHRIGLDMLQAALSRERSVYAQAVQAVRLLLPAPTRDDITAAAGLARTGPPTERVGLTPYTPAGGRS